MKLISTESLNNWIGNWLAKNKYYHPHSKCNSIPISELNDILELMPKVEAIPIEWIQQYGKENWFDFGTQFNAITRMLKAWEERKG